MANIINQINVGGTTYDVGAAAANVSVNPANAGVKSTLLEPALKEIPDNTINKYNANNLADNLTTGTAGIKALDAHQGSIIQTQTNNIMDIVYGKTTRAYAEGDFFMLNNKPYCVSTTIAADTTLTDSTVTSYATLLSESATNVLAGQIASINNTLTNLNSNSAGAHNAIFRGKNLGSSVTSAQSTAIQNGTFEDLYVGDYWSINDVNYRIAGCDPYLHCGDNVDLGHQLAIVPDTCLLNGNGKDTHFMNDTDITTGGYVGSKMYTTIIPSNDITGKIEAAFGSHLYSHREYLCNVVTNGIPSGGSWYDSAILLMNEVQVYGSVVNGNLNGNGSGIFNIGIGNSQLPLFRLAPQFIHMRQSYWLRDVVSASWFADVTNNGHANRSLASYTWYGVRPLFLIH